jgi:nebulin
MCPSLSPGIAGVFFLLCNTLLILNVQVLYKEDVSPGTAIGKTPEMMRVKQTQDHISSVKTMDLLPVFPASL